MPLPPRKVLNGSDGAVLVLPPHTARTEARDAIVRSARH